MMTGGKLLDDRVQYPFANFVKISFAHAFGCAGVPRYAVRSGESDEMILYHFTCII